MIKKIYECGCFNYQKFIFDNIKFFSLTSDEALVLTKIIEKFSKSKVLGLEELINELPLTKINIEHCLASLLERNFYEIYINFDNNGIGQEYISIEGFFNKARAILNNQVDDITDELFNVNQYLSKKLNRILTANEIEIISCLVLEDRYKLIDFEKACEYLKSKGKIITMKSLAQALSTKEEKEIKPTNNVAKSFFDNIL